MKSLFGCCYCYCYCFNLGYIYSAQIQFSLANIFDLQVESICTKSKDMEEGNERGEGKEGDLKMTAI